jgi:HlyD family secretion protein
MPLEPGSPEPLSPHQATPPAWWTNGAAGRPRRRALVVGATAAVAVLVGVAAFAGVSGASSGASGYRTAVASTEEVEQTLAGVGTIEPVDQAAVAFPVSGTVAAVDVSVGTTVVAGQVLATLDPTQLETSRHEAEATLAQAELTLEKVLNGESTGTTSGSSGAPGGSSGGASSGAASSGSTSTGSGSGTSSGSSVDQAALTAARQAVADAQRSLDADLAVAQAALGAATTACTTTSTSTSTSSTSSTSTTTTAGTGSQTCQDALAASLAAQQAVAADVAALDQAVSTLDGLLTAASTGSGTSGSAGSSGTGGSGATSSGSTTTTVSSSDVVAAQKAVDAAAAGVAVAEQAVAQGTIVSPIAGTVTSIGLEVGESVSAGSSTEVVRVVGQGGYQVTTSVAVTDLPHVKVGQSATVVADGTTTELTGTVVQIGLVASSSSGSSTTYPVVIALTDPDVGLPDGGLASVRIVTAATDAVTAVPTSAVTTTDTGHTVVVVKGGSPETIDVEVGTIGSTWTEITNGVSTGDTVVLADLSQALPGSATSSSGSSSGTTGRAGSFVPGGGGSFQPPSGMGARPGG